MRGAQEGQAAEREAYPMSKETIEIAAKLLMMSNQDIGRAASGGYGQHMQVQFLRDLRRVLSEVVPPGKAPFLVA